MTRIFQSRWRDITIPGQPPLQFVNYRLETSDEAVAARAERQCKANPADFYEVTSFNAPPPEPRVKMVRGMRTASETKEK